MRYRSDYQETHDIDWFFRYKGKAYHAASNGGCLPDSVDSVKNRTIQEKLEDVIGSYPVAFADNLVTLYGQYADLTSFAEYASKGFISLDRTENDEEVEEGKPVYHVVAYPSNGKSFDNEELLNLMPLLKDGDIEISN